MPSAPPPLLPDRPIEIKRKLPVFHIGDLVTVPEDPSLSSSASGGNEEDGYLEEEEVWEYTFSAMDISDDASIVAVGMEDFGAGYASYAVGLVRAFGWSCDEQRWRRLGQDLRGRNEYEQFGHSVSSSKDGRVMAVSAPQELSEEGNGFVDVYYLDDDDGGEGEEETTSGLWKNLGDRIEYSDASDDYDRWGHAIALGQSGDTLVVLGVVGSNSFVVRVFRFDPDKSVWKRKGKDLKLDMNYEDNYDFAPKLSLSEDGEEVSVTDPEFGVVRYHHHIGTNKWKKQDSKTVAFDDESYWISQIDTDDSGNVVAYSAFKAQEGDEIDVTAVKFVDFSEGDAREVFVKVFDDYAVETLIAVSDNGMVAALVASRYDYDDDGLYYDLSYVGAMTILSPVIKGGLSADGSWSVVGGGTDSDGMGVPGKFVTLSGDGRIAAVGYDNVVSFYGIRLPGDKKATAAPAAAPVDDSAGDPSETTTSNGPFDVCPPFPDASSPGEAGDLDSLPKQSKQHTLSMALSSNGSVAAVGIDSYDGEDRGLVRVFGWSCDPGAGGYVQMGQDLLGGGGVRRVWPVCGPIRRRPHPGRGGQPAPSRKVRVCGGVRL